MKIHEFGDKKNPVILLLSGTMCYWEGNFGGVIDNLAKNFLVAAVAYTGFDKTDNECYVSVIDETEKIEKYIFEHYNGAILAAYGCSLGGTFVAHLAARLFSIGILYFLPKKFEKRMADPDPYNKAFVSLVGRDKYDMSFIAKKSLKNQFKSDLITKLPQRMPAKNKTNLGLAPVFLLIRRCARVLYVKY